MELEKDKKLVYNNDIRAFVIPGMLDNSYFF